MFLVTEDDILNTLEEIYENENILEKCDSITEEKHQSTKSPCTKDYKIKNKLFKEETDAEENESPSFLKQLTKRKYTVIDPDVQIVSGLVIKILFYLLFIQSFYKNIYF